MEKNIQHAIKESKIDSVFNRNAVKMSTSIKDEDMRILRLLWKTTGQLLNRCNPGIRMICTSI
ncbi:hypothetical protein D3C87_414210 [compost metagenome]